MNGMKRAAKHGRYKNKRDEGWGGSHGWLRLKRSRGDKGGRGGDVAMTSQHTEREGTGRNGTGRNGTGREGPGRDERGLLEADGGAVFKALVAGFDELVLAELLDGGEGGVLAREDEVDGALACDVLDLTA